MSQRKHDHPGLLDRVPLEDVERIHRRDPYGIRLVGESEGSCLRSELLGGAWVARRGYRNEAGMVVGGHKRRRRTWAFTRTLACDDLQFAIGMLIGRMPEERRWPALLRFTDSVDRVARNLQQSKRLLLGAVLLPFGTSWIGFILHRHNYPLTA